MTVTVFPNETFAVPLDVKGTASDLSRTRVTLHRIQRFIESSTWIIQSLKLSEGK